VTFVASVDVSGPRRPRGGGVTMRGADEEQQVSEHERHVADAQRQHKARRDNGERERFRAVRAHERSAELYDAITRLRGE